MNSAKNIFSKEDSTAALFVILGASMWGVDGIVLRPALYG